MLLGEPLSSLAWSGGECGEAWTNVLMRMDRLWVRWDGQSNSGGARCWAGGRPWAGPRPFRLGVGASVGSEGQLSHDTSFLGHRVA